MMFCLYRLPWSLTSHDGGAVPHVKTCIVRYPTNQAALGIVSDLELDAYRLAGTPGYTRQNIVLDFSGNVAKLAAATRIKLESSNITLSFRNCRLRPQAGVELSRLEISSIDTVDIAFCRAGNVSIEVSKASKVYIRSSIFTSGLIVARVREARKPCRKTAYGGSVAGLDHLGCTFPLASSFRRRALSVSNASLVYIVNSSFEAFAGSHMGGALFIRDTKRVVSVHLSHLNAS